MAIKRHGRPEEVAEWWRMASAGPEASSSLARCTPSMVLSEPGRPCEYHIGCPRPATVRRAVQRRKHPASAVINRILTPRQPANKFRIKMLHRFANVA